MIVIPFVGLTVASAPGFAHYLGFLKPLQGNGFGAGFVEGFVPALVMALVGGLAVTATNRKRLQFDIADHRLCTGSSCRVSSATAGVGVQGDILSFGKHKAEFR